MTLKQRVLDAVNHKETDRIPITFDAEIEVYDALFHHFGISTREELFDLLHVDTWMMIPKNFIHLGKGGGYVFGPGHTYIQIDAPVSDILAMYDSAATYYPHRNRRVLC